MAGSNINIFGSIGAVIIFIFCSISHYNIESELNELQLEKAKLETSILRAQEENDEKAIAEPIVTHKSCPAGKLRSSIGKSAKKLNKIFWRQAFIFEQFSFHSFSESISKLQFEAEESAKMLLEEKEQKAETKTIQIEAELQAHPGLLG